jgi:transposase InsO family protein
MTLEETVGVSLRIRLREGPVRLAARLGIAPSTVHRILTLAGKWHDPMMGYAFVDTVIDDHSRVAYAEIHDDETASTAAGVLSRAIQRLADRGVTVERVLSDNGSAYRSHLWRDTCEALTIKPKRTRPYRPQTNGKIERFHRTMADGWAYARCDRAEHERREALAAWLHHYNHHRPHTACANQPPFTRLINVPGQYT